MTEIPEPLLARSRARRAALGLGGDGGGEAEADAPSAAPATTESAPSTAAAPAAAPAAVEKAAPPPEPVPPYIAAAERRKKVPVWALPVLAFLPVWAVIYAQTLSSAPSTEATQLELGAEVYASCSGCHGATGGGGAGRPLAAGEVLKTFPNIANQLEFVKVGSAGYEGVPYGNPAREGGAHNGLSFGRMPAWPALTDAQLLEVVRHERETLSGEKGDFKVDDKGNRLWPDGKPMLNDSGKLIWPDGTLMFSADGKLTQQPDPSQPPA